MNVALYLVHHFIVQDQFCETATILDLNPVENLRGSLAREEYKKGAQCANKDKQTSFINLPWKNTCKQTLNGLSKPMIGRLIRVIGKKSGFVEY